MKGVYMFMADGFEDIEALGTRDVLVRGGVDVKMVGIDDEMVVVSARGASVVTDISLDELVKSGAVESGADADDVMIFPGGLPGAANLAGCDLLINIMNRHFAEGGAVAAICASPKFVFGKLKGMENAEFTCYDGCEDSLVAAGATFLRKPSVTCGRIITGRGPGHAIDFGLAILRFIKGDAAADAVAADMTLPCTD